jgi:translation elongation factor P/translation initiation factor 5A
LILDGNPVKLVEFLHVKPGKGAAFVRTKIKNLITGSVLEKTFRAGESIIPADIEKRQIQFSYEDDDLIVFIDPETMNQESFNKDDYPNWDLLNPGLSVIVLLASVTILFLSPYLRLHMYNSCLERPGY